MDTRQRFLLAQYYPIRCEPNGRPSLEADVGNDGPAPTNIKASTTTKATGSENCGFVINDLIREMRSKAIDVMVCGGVDGGGGRVFIFSEKYRR